ncbi:MAG TPA: hypothetical protein V6C71_05335 [Coleofasciculaceae cyanobacterium]
MKDSSLNNQQRSPLALNTKSDSENSLSVSSLNQAKNLLPALNFDWVDLNRI